MPQQAVAVGERYEPVVAGDAESYRVAAGRVRASGEDVAWVLADLAPALVGVGVFSVCGESEVVRDSEFRWGVEGVTVMVHVKGAADAARVAGMFDLVGVEELRNDGRSWRTWTGYLTDAGRAFPVCLSLTACIGSVPW